MKRRSLKQILRMVFVYGVYFRLYCLKETKMEGGSKKSMTFVDSCVQDDGKVVLYVKGHRVDSIDLGRKVQRVWQVNVPPFEHFQETLGLSHAQYIQTLFRIDYGIVQKQVDGMVLPEPEENDATVSIGDFLDDKMLEFFLPLGCLNKASGEESLTCVMLIEMLENYKLVIISNFRSGEVYKSSGGNGDR